MMPNTQLHIFSLGQRLLRASSKGHHFLCRAGHWCRNLAARAPWQAPALSLFTLASYVVCWGFP